MKKLVLFFIYLLFIIIHGYSQKIENDFQYSIKEVNTPFKTNVYKQYQTSKLIRTGIGAITYTGIGFLTYKYIDAPLQQWSQKHKSPFTNSIFSYGPTMGRHKIIMITSVGLAASGFLVKNNKLKKAGLISIAALTLNDCVTSNLKKTFQRHRPNTGSSPYTFDGRHGTDRNHSLPSSHTSSAFCIATVIASVFNENKAIPILAYSSATLVGLSRIHDNAHWGSDVLAGAAVGFLTAKGTLLLTEIIDKKIIKKRFTH